ncbi:MAG: hypothetical protein A3I02_03290 [Betaproteobacteria bacterium RIFCSPLOWO2_02_FULL_67_26]|nr:MAG: hypothetical protein A3I02_03290 [Betaproteobacteria bacterium RIFCSPLOWO2_02_FULL_67_26]
MNQPEQELARKIIQVLDRGVDHLEPAVRERLAAARASAVARYRDRPETLPGLAWAGQAAARLSEIRFYNAWGLIAVAAMVLALAGIVYWRSNGPASDFAEVDMGLLTDELPLNAYVDKGFDSWLKRSPR